jgi:hypothetical protein
LEQLVEHGYSLWSKSLSSAAYSNSTNNNFYLLSSVSVFDQPISVPLKKEILKNFNSRPDNVYGKNARIIVMDSGGLITGTANTVLEVFPYLSKGADAKDFLGNSNYYKNYIFRNSKYIYAIDPPSYGTTASTWGYALANNFYFATIATTPSFTLSNGSDDAPTDANRNTGWDLFSNTDEVEEQWHYDNLGKFKRAKFKIYCNTLDAEATILESICTAFMEEYYSED